jgi:hypothetical protein
VVASEFLIPCANCSESEVHCLVCTRKHSDSEFFVLA